MKPQLIKVILSIAFLFPAIVSKSQSTSCETAQDVYYACSESNAPSMSITSDDIPNISLPLACPLGAFQEAPTREYWIRFTALHINVNVKLNWSQGSTLSNLNPMLEVYSGNCASLQYVACNYNQNFDSDQDLYLSGLIVGQQYFIRVLDNNYIDPTGEFGWSQYYYIEVCADCGDVNLANVSSTASFNNCTGAPIPLTSPSISGVAYQWLYNGENIAAANSNQLNATQTGAYSILVTPTDNAVCPAYTTAAVILHIGTPANISSNGQLAICGGQSTELIAPLAPGNTYQWGNPSTIPGAVSSSYIVTTPGIYFLTLNDGICPESTAQITIGTGTQPTAPLISPQGNLVLCNGSNVLLSAPASAGLSYQWTLDGNIINNETSTSYTADAPGIYCLIAANASGCKDTSNCLPVTNCVGFETIAEHNVKIYPNPSMGTLTVELPQNMVAEAINICDMQGRLITIEMLKTSSGQIQITTADLENGMYQLLIQTRAKIINKRFTKISN